MWDKKKIGMGYHYRARYEFILFYEKGKRKLNDLSIPDILEAPRIHRGYPAEKPVPLSETLIQQSSTIGEIVLDPFRGSGRVGVAALKHRRSFLGNDLSQDAVCHTLGRLQNPIADGSRSVGDRQAEQLPNTANASQLLTELV